MYDEIATIAKAERGIAGSFFWSAVGPAFREPDAFSVRLQAVPRRQDQGLAAQFSNLVEGSSAHVFQGLRPLEHPQLPSETGAVEADKSKDVLVDAVLCLIIDHAFQMSSLNVSWLPECPMM